MKGTGGLGRLYGLAVLPRAGLGNMLIPWANCFVWCRDNRATMLGTTWTKLRIGPYLRRERDHRAYQRYFKPMSPGALVGKFIVRMLAEVFDEGQRAKALRQRTGVRPSLVLFTDMNRFSGLIGREEEVRTELRRITLPQFQPPSACDSPFIAVHVRLGDFPTAATARSAHLANYRLPISWYIGAIAAIRSAAQLPLRVVVFSDGSDSELSELLSVPGVTRSPYKSAIGDILAMATASAMVTSRSTFSLWGCYLSQAPSLWYGNPKEITGGRVLSRPDYAQLEVQWSDGQELSPEFSRAVQEHAASKGSAGSSST